MSLRPIAYFFFWFFLCQKIKSGLHFTSYPHQAFTHNIRYIQKYHNLIIYLENSSIVALVRLIVILFRSNKYSILLLKIQWYSHFLLLLSVQCIQSQDLRSYYQDAELKWKRNETTIFGLTVYFYVSLWRHQNFTVVVDCLPTEKVWIKVVCRI